MKCYIVASAFMNAEGSFAIAGNCMPAKDANEARTVMRGLILERYPDAECIIVEVNALESDHMREMLEFVERHAEQSHD